MFFDDRPLHFYCQKKALAPAASDADTLTSVPVASPLYQLLEAENNRLQQELDESAGAAVGSSAAETTVNNNTASSLGGPADAQSQDQQLDAVLALVARQEAENKRLEHQLQAASLAPARMLLPASDGRGSSLSQDEQRLEVLKTQVTELEAQLVDIARRNAAEATEVELQLMAAQLRRETGHSRAGGATTVPVAGAALTAPSVMAEPLSRPGNSSRPISGAHGAKLRPEPPQSSHFLEQRRPAMPKPRTPVSPVDSRTGSPRRRASSVQLPPMSPHSSTA